VTHPLFGAYLVVLVSLPLFHAAHRVLAAFMDFGFRGRRSVLAALLYGGALAGSAYTLWTVFIR
jgi:fumarate reductase subunit D